MNMEALYQSAFDLLFKAEESNLENFKLGFVAGVLVFAILAVLIRLVLLYLSRGDRRSRGIKISGDNGSIVISPGAISDLVKGIGNGIKHVEVSKVKLLEAQDETLYLEVHIVMAGGETRFGDISNEFQRQVVETVKDRFGVQCIKSVAVHLDKIVDVKPA